MGAFGTALRTVPFLAGDVVRLARLRQIRQRRFLSQAELAEKAGIGENTIRRLELGQTEPRGRTVRRLAEALGVTPEDLIGDTGPATKRS